MTDGSARATAEGPPELAAEHPPLLLSELADALGVGERRGDAALTGVSVDSRRVGAGDCFLAVAGLHADGHLYAADAVRRGAAALVVEHFVDLDVPQLRVPSVAELAGPLASLVFHSPSRQMPVVGVTGTNGKTTTCQLIRACFAAAGGLAGQIGTTGTYLGDRLLATSSLSTPEAPELQRHLFEMARAGAAGVAMEVTSHGLDRHRVDGTSFRVGVFLNLSPEHLDYHGTMENYFAAKRRLFAPERCSEAIVCVDEEWGRRLAAECAIAVRTFSVRPGADVMVRCRSAGLAGIVVELETPEGPVEIASPLIGVVNAANVAAAYLAACAAGVDPQVARAAIAACPAPPGRFEVLSGHADVLAVVDYAHTPDALAAQLRTAREVARGRVHLVLGARGERYAAKRPEMARVAAAADAVVLTTDSPGEEDPGQIVKEMLAGVPDDRRAVVRVELDRAAAIRQAVASLTPGDIVLVTGRGHETTQRFGADLVPLDDRVVVRLALAARPGREPTGAEGRAVAVVIPAHDDAQTIGAAIDSVLAQSVPVAEIVVVDDGSSDGTGDIARRRGAGVRVLEQPCLGPSAARNAGVAATTSPLIAFLDADDVWHPEKIARQLAALESSAAVLCAADWSRGAPPPLDAGALETSTVATDDLLVINRFQTSTVLVRRHTFALSGGFSARLDGAEDWDLWVRISRLGPVVKIDAPLVTYRDRPAGYSKDLRRHHDAVLAIVERELAGTPTARARELRAWHHLRFAIAFRQLGDRERARACLRRIGDEGLRTAAVPASARLLAPFLAGRALRRLRRAIAPGASRPA